MEFRPSRSNDKIPSRRVIVPPARNNRQSLQPPSSFQQTPNPDEQTRKKMTTEELTEIRENLGFDDIPVDALDDRSMKEIFLAWSKQRLGTTDKKKNVNRLFNGKKFRQWKDDLKWALEADLEDTNELHQAKNKLSTTPQKPSPSIHPSNANLPNQRLHPTPPRSQHLGDTKPEEYKKSVEININFGSLPKISKLPRLNSLGSRVQKIKEFRWTRRRIIIIIATVITLLILLSFAKVIPILTHKNNAQNQPAKTASQTSKTPEYKTVLPAGKTVDDFGGWKRVSPPDREAVFAYSDKVDGIQISVSQQKLPDSFQPDVDEQVAELAKSFSATDKIDSEGMKIYVGTSAKGPQSVILVKNDTLILIKSQSKVSDESWTAYAKSLQ